MKLKLIIPFILLILTGCWNYNELNDIALITSMSIDKENNNFLVSVGIANTNKDEITLYSGNGKSISEAIKNIELYIPKKLYFGHLSVIIISDNIAKEGLERLSNYILRSKDIPKNTFLLISKDTQAKQILKSISPLDTFPSITISSKFLDINNNTQTTTFNNYIQAIKKIGIEPIIPAVSLVQNEDKNKTKLDTIAIFKKDKLIKIATEKESKGINIILNKQDEILIPITCNNTIIQTNKINTKTKFKNNTLYINVTASGIIKELDCNNKETIKETENEIKKIIENSIKLSKENNTDILGFGNTIYKHNPKYYNKNIFKNIKIKTKVKFNLNKEGNIEKN